MDQIYANRVKADYLELAESFKFDLSRSRFIEDERPHDRTVSTGHGHKETILPLEIAGHLLDPLQSAYCSNIPDFVLSNLGDGQDKKELEHKCRVFHSRFDRSGARFIELATSIGLVENNADEKARRRNKRIIYAALDHYIASYLQVYLDAKKTFPANMQDSERYRNFEVSRQGNWLFYMCLVKYFSDALARDGFIPRTLRHEIALDKHPDVVAAKSLPETQTLLHRYYQSPEYMQEVGRGGFSAREEASKGTIRNT